jgi:hypothetical protein
MSCRRKVARISDMRIHYRNLAEYPESGDTMWDTEAR